MFTVEALGSVLLSSGHKQVISGVCVRSHWHECKCACRAQNDAFRNDVVQEVMSGVDRICSRRKLGCLVQRVHDAEAVQCSPALVQGLIDAVKDSEQASMQLCKEHNDYDQYCISHAGKFAVCGAQLQAM